MFVAFAISAEPEIEFLQLSFHLTESESEAAVVRLCEEFVDNQTVEMDWINFPDDPIPSGEQLADANYIQETSQRIMEAYFGDPEWMAEFKAVASSDVSLTQPAAT